MVLIAIFDFQVDYIGVVYHEVNTAVELLEAFLGKGSPHGIWDGRVTQQ